MIECCRISDRFLALGGFQVGDSAFAMVCSMCPSIDQIFQAPKLSRKYPSTPLYDRYITEPLDRNLKLEAFCPKPSTLRRGPLADFPNTPGVEGRRLRELEISSIYKQSLLPPIKGLTSQYHIFRIVVYYSILVLGGSRGVGGFNIGGEGIIPCNMSGGDVIILAGGLGGLLFRAWG